MSEILLNVSMVKPITHANGPGARASIWVQGCTIGCHGCYNAKTHAHEPNSLISPDEIAVWYLSQIGIDGITFSGGEPFEQAQAVLETIQLIDLQKGQEVSVFIYTGFEIEQLQNDSNPYVEELLKRVDILSAGPFIQKLHDPNLLWRGSTNQRLHFLSERYNESMIEKWKKDSPIEEITLSANWIYYTGFGGPSSDLVKLAKNLIKCDS